MFDISLGEALVIVTTIGFLFNRKDIKAGARLAGQGFGHLVGTLQGLRFRFDQKNQNNRVVKLHSSVTKSLQELRTIGYDFAAIGSSNIAASMTTSNINKRPQSHMGQTNGMNNGGEAGGIDTKGHVAGVAPTVIGSATGTGSGIPTAVSWVASNVSATKTDNNSTGGSTGVNAQVPSQHTAADDEAIEKLARLILVEQKFKEERNVHTASQGNESGADLIESAISESILNESYARKLGGGQ
jgi:hypothetical protein